MAEHEVNTATMEFASSGVRHVEGGWPKDVSFSETDQTLRYRKKVEKDEFYIQSVLQLGAKIEHCIRQNNAVDIYENYWEDDVVGGASYSSPLLVHEDTIKTMDVARDPLAGLGLPFNAPRVPGRNETKTGDPDKHTDEGSGRGTTSALLQDGSKTLKNSGEGSFNGHRGTMCFGNSLGSDDSRLGVEREPRGEDNDSGPYNQKANLRSRQDGATSPRSGSIVREPVERPSTWSRFEGRGITGICFAPGASCRKVAAAYSSSIFMCPTIDVPRTAYVWDISSTSRVEVALEGPSWIHTLRYNPKEPSIIGAGLHNGQCGFWDVRAGPRASGLTPIRASHRQVVTGIGWVPAKTRNELLSTATDGQVMWWDLRKLDVPVESVMLVPGHSAGGEGGPACTAPGSAASAKVSIAGAVSIATVGSRKPSMAAAGAGSHMPSVAAGPAAGVMGQALAAATAETQELGPIGRPMTGCSLAKVSGATAKVLVGTEQGAVLAINRRARNLNDRVGSPYHAHPAPVYSVERNPAFPKNFLTVGDWTVKLWAEDFYSSAILSTPPAPSRVWCACWCPSRSSVLLSGRQDGGLDVWDLVSSWTVPRHSLQVFDCAVECVSVHDSGRLAALGSATGSLSLLRLPHSLSTPLDKTDKTAFTAILERETRRERLLATRRKEKRLRERVRVPPPPLDRGQPITPLDPLQEAEDTYWATMERMRADLETEEAAECAEQEKLAQQRHHDAERAENEQELSSGEQDGEPLSSSSGEPER